MRPHRLRAPRTDGALLEEPPMREAPARLARNAERLAGWSHDFQGRRAGRLRAMARHQALEQSRAYLLRLGLDVPEQPRPDAPFVVTGHQPELYHPGVWVKNFATDALARRVGGAGVNLIVDNDIPKGTSIRVPDAAVRPLRARRVEFDDWAGEVPFEDLGVRNEALFESFAERVRGTLGGVVPDPLIDDYWPRVLRHRGQTARLGLRFAAARRELEASWGAHNFDVPLSAVCETEGFLWFACHLLAHLPRFQQVHNEALDRYREAYGIRSRHHPVPALGRQGEWLEAPFWAWRAGSPRRRPLLARQLARTMLLRLGGEDEPLMEIPLGPDREACCAVDQLKELPARSIRLRTRALTTTMFGRYVLGDLFIHGIGGAKYDELGDEVARQFFGIEPPDYLTLSLTLWMGLPGDPAEGEDLRRVDRLLRDLQYNPDRHLGEELTPEAQALVEAKRAAIGAAQATPRERRARFRELRRCNEALQPWIRERRREAAAQRRRLADALEHNSAARSREYAFVLHSGERLREAMSAATVAIGST